VTLSRMIEADPIGSAIVGTAWAWWAFCAALLLWVTR
jgi:hypothetical protein